MTDDASRRLARIAHLRAGSPTATLLRCARSLEGRQRPTRLRPTHLRVMELLLTERGARGADVARALGVSRQAVHQLLGELDAAGLLSVKVDAADGRARRVRLSARGLAAAEAEAEVTRALDAALVRRLGAKKLSVLHALLSEVAGVLER